MLLVWLKTPRASSQCHHFQYLTRETSCCLICSAFSCHAKTQVTLYLQEVDNVHKTNQIHDQWTSADFADTFIKRMISKRRVLLFSEPCARVFWFIITSSDLFMFPVKCICFCFFLLVCFVQRCCALHPKATALGRNREGDGVQRTTD